MIAKVEQNTNVRNKDDMLREIFQSVFFFKADVQ